MALITRQLPALYNGVSTQPAPQRLPSQWEESDNTRHSVVEGNSKRLPFKLVSVVDSSGTSFSNSSFTHNVETAEGRFQIVIHDQELRVYDMDTGIAQTVSFPVGTTYLDVAPGQLPTRTFSAVSIGDYTFITNRNVTVATKVPPTAVPAAWANWYFPKAWGIEWDQTKYYNEAGYILQSAVQTFSALPTSGNSFKDVRKILGNDTDGFSAYWVTYVSTNVWSEFFDPSDSIGLDETTMPHALVRKADGTWTFTVFPWKVRKVGDDYTNPPPSFVGTQLRDVFYFKNRLGLLTDKNAILSAASDFGNFFRTTVTDLLDSDVIDVAPSSQKELSLEYAVPYNNTLMIFGGGSQFIINTSEVLSANTISIDQVAEYAFRTAATGPRPPRPVSVGSQLYFSSMVDESSQLREFTSQGDQLSEEAADVSAHAPGLLATTLRCMAGSSAIGSVLLANSAALTPNSVFVYSFMWNGDEKLQSAWSKWSVGPADGSMVVLHIAVYHDAIYLFVMRRHQDPPYANSSPWNEFAILKMDTAGKTGSFPFAELDAPLLDYGAALANTAAVHSAGVTTFTLPFSVTEATDQAAMQMFNPYTGLLMDLTGLVWTDAWQFTLPGNLTWSAGDYRWIGFQYKHRLTFSEQFPKINETPLIAGDLHINDFSVYFKDTACFKVRTWTHTQDIDLLVDTVLPERLAYGDGRGLAENLAYTRAPTQLVRGSYDFAVDGDSKRIHVELLNDTPYPSNFTAAEWRGRFESLTEIV